MSFSATRVAKCDGWCDAPAPVSHVDEKGYVYCAACGPRRKQSGIYCRKMTPLELRYVRAGMVIPHSYHNARRSNGALPLCPACVRHTTSGGTEPGAMDGLRPALPGEACSAPDCVARA